MSLASRSSVLSACLIAASLLWSTSARALCPGDCNGNGQVDISELIRAVAIALGSLPVSECRAVDTNNSDSVSISELVAGVNAALIGCPASTPTPPPPATPTTGIAPIFPANYDKAFVEVRGCRFSIEHGGVSIRVLANQIAAEPYRRNQNPLPEGSIVVKEEYSGERCNEADLVRWRAMRKEAPGFDAEDADWHWQWVDAPGRGVRFDDKSTCISCHRAEPCLARDYMCTVAGRGELHAVLENQPAALLSVAGTGPTDVYAVGADSNDGRGPLVLHYDGEAWTRLITGVTDADLWWISVTPIDGDFFMAGSNGVILQYDPSGGGFMRHTTPGTERLFGVWGLARDDIWAVGGLDESPDTSGTIWHYDGEMWTRQDLAGIREGGLPRLFKVWGRAADDVYAVGARGVVLHFDGKAWALVDSGTPRSLFTVHGNASDTVAVGGFFADGLVIERRGSGSFTARTPADIPQLNGLFISEDGQGVAVGNFLSTAVRDAGTWQVVTAGSGDEGRDFHAAWVDSEGGIWAVGGDLTLGLVKGIIAYGGPRQVSGLLR